VAEVVPSLGLVKFSIYGCRVRRFSTWLKSSSHRSEIRNASLRDVDDLQSPQAHCASRKVHLVPRPIAEEFVKHRGRRRSEVDRGFLCYELRPELRLVRLMNSFSCSLGSRNAPQNDEPRSIA